VNRCERCKKPIAQPATGRRRRFCDVSCRVAAHRRCHRCLRSRLEVMGSSRSVEWPTDPAVFAHLHAEFQFDLDPCATVESAKCARYFTRTNDGLAQEWLGRVFMNPPYGREIGKWMRKAWEASQSSAELVVCLVPARTDTAWWHDYANRGEIRFLRGRLRFGDLKNSAPFPSAIVPFRNAERVTKGEAA
jgi:phage N-6-adenine-methyltransferase